MPGLAVRSPDAASLVVWARDADGAIQGGQRILIDTDGAPLDSDVRKPAFGAISGVPARFAARDGKLARGPLVIAEGPESALAAWAATGLETWAVFGVSGFAAAPVPGDREVILAPDRDAPESPAGRAFRQAVAEHLERGRNLKVAMAPEPSGSKSDLNDTLQRAGLAEVRAAIDGRAPGPGVAPCGTEPGPARGGGGDAGAGPADTGAGACRNGQDAHAAGGGGGLAGAGRGGARRRPQREGHAGARAARRRPGGDALGMGSALGAW